VDRQLMSDDRLGIRERRPFVASWDLMRDPAAAPSLPGNA
jgi:hypothetical protein